MGGQVDQGYSAAAGRSHTGPLGLHLVALAPSSPAPTAGLGLKERKQALEKWWSSKAGPDSSHVVAPTGKMESSWELWICVAMARKRVREAQRKQESTCITANWERGSENRMGGYKEREAEESEY